VSRLPGRWTVAFKKFIVPRAAGDRAPKNTVVASLSATFTVGFELFGTLFLCQAIVDR
jgi:hypothetical protein